MLLKKIVQYMLLQLTLYNKEAGGNEIKGQRENASSVPKIKIKLDNSIMVLNETKINIRWIVKNKTVALLFKITLGIYYTVKCVHTCNR